MIIMFCCNNDYTNYNELHELKMIDFNSCNWHCPFKLNIMVVLRLCN